MASPMTTSPLTLSQIEAEAGKSFEEAVKNFAQNSGRREINILATGKHAAGKSALVNGLIGEEVAPENDSLDPGTTRIVKYSRNIDGVLINIWDSPGLEANTEDETRNVEMIARDVSEADILLFCIRMDESRLRKQDLNTIIHFTKAFGQEVWRHTIFAMTFANMAIPIRSKDDPEAKKIFFNDRLKLWSEQLEVALLEAGVTKEIVEEVNIVPVGYYNNPSLPNGQENWLTVFWLVCLHAMKKQAQPALLKVNLNRLKSVQELEPVEDYSLPFYRRPIVVDTVRKAVVPTATGLVGGAIGFILGGPVWMAVGGVIGAMAGYIFTNGGFQFDMRVNSPGLSPQGDNTPRFPKERHSSEEFGVEDLAHVYQKVWDARAKWYNIGLELGVLATTLDSIKRSNQGDVDRCFRETLREWLQTRSRQRSWRILAEALRKPSVGFNDLANQL